MVSIDAVAKSNSPDAGVLAGALGADGESNEKPPPPANGDSAGVDESKENGDPNGSGVFVTGGGCGESNEKPAGGVTGGLLPLSVENGEVDGVPGCFSSSNVNPKSLAWAELRALGAGPSTTNDCAGADAWPMACSRRPRAG